MKRKKLYGCWMLLYCLSLVIFAEPVQAETLEGLSRRVEILEQAVAELQAQCIADSTKKNVSRKVKQQDIWTCQVTGRRKKFYGNGLSRGLAERDAMEQCQQASDICRLKACAKD